jgi:hypothetical protein
MSACSQIRFGIQRISSVSETMAHTTSYPLSLPSNREIGTVRSLHMRRHFARASGTDIHRPAERKSDLRRRSNVGAEIHLKRPLGVLQALNLRLLEWGFGLHLSAKLTAKINFFHCSRSADVRSLAE